MYCSMVSQFSMLSGTDVAAVLNGNDVVVAVVLFCTTSSGDVVVVGSWFRGCDDNDVDDVRTIEV